MITSTFKPVPELPIPPVEYPPHCQGTYTPSERESTCALTLNLELSVKFMVQCFDCFLDMIGNLPNVNDLRARHTTWDKPTTENLKQIGTIEFFWRNLFEAIFHPNQDNWQEPWKRLHDLILERCPNNDERRTTLYYLEHVKHLMTKEGDWTRHWKKVLIYLENTRDWARKSIIRA